MGKVKNQLHAHSKSELLFRIFDGNDNQIGTFQSKEEAFEYIIQRCLDLDAICDEYGLSYDVVLS